MDNIREMQKKGPNQWMIDVRYSQMQKKALINEKMDDIREMQKRP